MVLQTKKRNLEKARKFADTFHLLDDYCTANDSSEFGENFKEI